MRLAPEAIVGELLGPQNADESIAPENFVRNQVFVDFMHVVISQRAPTLSDVIAEAHRQGEGWVYIVDQRSHSPQGDVPPADIVGAFEVRNGRVIQNSYCPNPRHMLLTVDGFFSLGDELTECLLEELAARLPNQRMYRSRF